MSKDKVDILATAFGKLKQKVIWKLKSTGNCEFELLYSI